MKIAIPSDDQSSISQHFGRTAGFMIVEIDNNQVVKKEYKSNTFTGHAQGLHEEGQHGDHAQHNSSHAGIFSAMGDCKVVIAGGMGQRLYTDFAQRQIQVFVTSERNIDKALSLYLADNLDNNSDKCCNHTH